MSHTWISLEEIRPTAKRVIRLAQAVFQGLYSDIVWRERDSYQRLIPFEGDNDERFPSRWIMRTGEPLWISDFATDPVALTHGFVAKGDQVKCFVGVPIRLPDSDEVLGVLGGIDHVARERDEAVLARLRDLADLLAEAIQRVMIVSERERDAARLAEALESTAWSEQRLRLATQLARVDVWEIDHRRRRANADTLAPEGGYNYEEAVREVWDAVHPEDRERVAAAWQAHLDGGPPMQIIHRRPSKAGGWYWVESAAEAVRGPDGRVTRVVGALRNIHREKESERELIEARNAAEAANEAKSTFLATVSHEIRTPLNGVLGMAQAMAAEDLPSVQRERLNVIRQSGESLLAIVNDVLDLSKIGAGKLKLEAIDFDLTDLVDAVRATFAPIAEAKELTLDVEIDPSAAGVYRGDPVRIRQILYNLVSNALKFTEAGGVRVSVARGEALELSVIDTGIGIPPEAQASLFRPFTQVDSSTTRRFGGTGLGLSICRELTALMGGTIAMESRVGEGAAFKVALPLPFVRSGRAARPHGAPEQAPIAATPEPLRILAAEDNPVNQLVLKTLLGQLGLDVTVVENGRQAVDAWAAEAWDVILMDAQMPIMDGLRATREIREREADSGRARTPILALTANALSHQVAEYRACGMDGFVAKPVVLEELVEALQSLGEADDDLDPKLADAAG